MSSPWPHGGPWTHPFQMGGGGAKLRHYTPQRDLIYGGPSRLHPSPHPTSQEGGEKSHSDPWGTRRGLDCHQPQDTLQTLPGLGGGTHLRRMDGLQPRGWVSLEKVSLEDKPAQEGDPDLPDFTGSYEPSGSTTEAMDWGGGGGYALDELDSVALH